MHGKHSPPAALPGFEHIKRSWNTQHGNYLARIKPGEYYVTRHNEGILTVLGSCISACVRDRASKIGGMNHFMPPSSPSDPTTWSATGLGAATRYGNYAMEHLINEVLKNAKNGCKRENLEVKIFGGCRAIEAMADIGKRNILFVRDYLEIERLQVAVEDVGDIYPRTVVYFPATGLVRVRRLKTMHVSAIAAQEQKYMAVVTEQPVTGAIELF